MVTCKRKEGKGHRSGNGIFVWLEERANSSPSGRTQKKETNICSFEKTKREVSIIFGLDRGGFTFVAAKRVRKGRVAGESGGDLPP